jgi:Glycosyl transferase family 11
MGLVCYAKLPKTGLGNRLFPWARSVVYSQIHGLPRLAPIWWNVQFGPMLRGEKDWRWYVGQFKSTSQEVAGLNRAFALATKKRLAEPKTLQSVVDSPDGIIEFSDFSLGGKYFSELNEYFPLVRTSLLESVTSRWKPTRSVDDEPMLGIHVRRGDFKAMASGVDTSNMNNVQTPVNWFRDCLILARLRLKKTIQAFVVSDGNDEELEGLLSLPKVSRVSRGSAIGDMLALSNANAILCSGESTFSLWAAYLGQMPCFFPTGHGPDRYYFSNACGRVSSAFDPDNPDEELLDEFLRPFSNSLP